MMTAPPVLPCPLADEPGLPAPAKAHLLADWQRFIYSGFKQLFFSRNLYRFLQQHVGFAAHFNQANCWAFYCNADLGCLLALGEQFGGSHRTAELGDLTWLAGALNSPAR